MDNNNENNHSSSIENHVYDEIVENNNPMPGWWVWLFIGTVIFAGIYYIHYTFGGGDSLKQEFDLAMNELKQVQAQNGTGMQSNVSDEALALIGKDPNALALAGKVFSEKCSMCHGAELQGVIGPNLVDKYWINGKGTHKDIYNLIANGVPEKGMPAWGTLLKEDELKALTAYVFSKKGSQPASPKAPQGVLIDN